MKAVEINRYGPAGVLSLNENVPMPEIAPDEVLVQNRASSVNPIDTLKRTGYGRSIFARKRRREFPWIMGNDVAGVIIQTGAKVSKFNLHDEVFCALSGFGPGAWAEYIAVPADIAAIKPLNLSFEEAASIPYVGLTAWAALAGRGGLSPGSGSGKKALVHGGSGGVGSFAIQLLKAWGWFVATTCSTRNVALVKAIGADEIIDYTAIDFSDELKNYDLVFDTVGVKVPGYEERSIAVLKPNSSSTYISIVHPLVRSLDRYGFLFGGLIAASDLVRKKIRHRKIGYHWSIFKPDGRALDKIRPLIESGAIRPVIDKTYTLEQMPEAHQYVESGQARGKVGIRI